ncbi:penicillin-binding protein [Bacillus ectoiniformans]|uniref:penicillin-binding transpeptidase domain-containing protein n=1 Tax=Bacillus ectoiniformans TaxID=1494429 RepID=UPI001956B980|nr:penicillin-binding transpeptidase domain-containing protein [Bacillus ectoiniformans]MBM7648396.1 penicillin-binding protein [Bacillus ectoiniformans]
MKKIYLLAGMLFLIAALAGCNKVPAPEERLNEYVKLWNEQKFEPMYKDYLASSAKKTVKQKEFAERYETIYSDLEVKNLKITSLSKEETDWKDKKEVSLPIKVTMDTLAGPISFEKKVQLKLEEREEGDNWFVNWNSTYIFPKLEKGDKVRIRTIPGERGQIFDRNGNSLAINGRGYEAGLIAGEADEAKKKEVASLLDLSSDFIEEQLQQSWVQPGQFVPLKKVSLYNDSLINQLRGMQGVTLQEQAMREYPYKQALAHLTGFIGDITAEELKELKNKGYNADDQVGKRGLEQLLEEKLREKDGKEIYIEKQKAEPVTLAKTPAKNGEDIKVAIDAELQKVIYNQLNNEPGTAAAIHPKTGEVLALASSPGFDPNEFVLGVSTGRYTALQNDPQQPLLNRFAAAYSPGSTIKPIIAGIALKAGTLNPKNEREITGLQWQKDSSWGSYKVTRVKDIGEPVNLQEALIHSDNIYFAQTALEAGKDRITTGLKAFGYADKLPFEYPIRSSQISNSGDLNKTALLSDTGYGQGEVLNSMLHLASAYSAIVNNGTMMKPLLYAEDEKATWKEGLLSEKGAQLLQQNLRLVVQKGTAKDADLPGMEIAGKTGTAELKSTQGTKGKENGLFVAYDQKNPQFVLALMFEDVREKGGSKVAVKAGKAIFKEWNEVSP